MNQIEFNPYCCDEDILNVCKEHGIVIQAYSPIGSGTKIGRRGETISGENEKKLTLIKTDVLLIIFNFSVLDDPVLKEIADKMGCSLGQLCIAWALRKCVAVSTKTEKEKRMEENLHSYNFADKITEEDMNRIGELNIDLRKYFEPYTIP